MSFITSFFKTLKSTKSQKKIDTRNKSKEQMELDLTKLKNVLLEISLNKSIKDYDLNLVIAGAMEESNIINKYEDFNEGDFSIIQNYLITKEIIETLEKYKNLVSYLQESEFINKTDKSEMFQTNETFYSLIEKKDGLAIYIKSNTGNYICSLVGTLFHVRSISNYNAKSLTINGFKELKLFDKGYEKEYKAYSNGFILSSYLCNQKNMPKTIFKSGFQVDNIVSLLTKGDLEINRRKSILMEEEV